MEVYPARLFALHDKVESCPAVQNVLHLAVMAPLLQGGHPSWMVDLALREAEGVLQWFIDSMVSMFASDNSLNYSFFYILHQILVGAGRLADVAENGVESASTSAGMAKVRGVHDSARAALASHVSAFRLHLLWGAPFRPATASGLLAAAAASESAVAGNGSASSETALGAPMPCSLEAALALAALADVTRLSVGAHSVPFMKAIRAVQACLDDVTSRRGPLIQQLMSPDSPPVLLALDRLECKPEVVVSLNDDPIINESPEALHDNFLMALLPIRDWESDFVRGFREVHCSDHIRKLVHRRAPLDRGGVFVDVGANIGGCALWAAWYMRDMQVVAVEPYKAATDALQRTVAMNKLESRVQVVHACIRHEGASVGLRRLFPTDHASWSVLQVQWQLVERGPEEQAWPGGRAEEEAEQGAIAGRPVPEFVRCRRLDEVVTRRIAVMRIHTSGTEDSALESAAGLARRGLLGAVALQFPSLAQARLLWQFGLSVELADQVIPHGDEEAFEKARSDPKVGFHGVLVAVDGLDAG